MVKPRNILAVKLGGIGDVVLITPALKALRKTFPTAYIALMAEEPSAEVVRGSPYIDELIIFTKLYRVQQFWKFLSRPHLLSQAWQLVKTLSRRRWDIYIAFHHIFEWTNVIKPMLLAYLSRAPIRTGLYSSSLCFYLNLKVPDNISQHLTQRYLKIIQALGAHYQDTKTTVWITEKDRNFAQEFLAVRGIKKEDLLVGIHPGANPEYLFRCAWRLERFIEVANWIIENYGAKILITGGPTEKDLVHQMAEKLNHPPVIVTDVNIKKVAAVISYCQLFISNDTGPMHLAVAMGVPTIGIFGPGTGATGWQTYGGYPPETNFIMLKKYVGCEPCRQRQCRTRACIDIITVEDVLEAVAKQFKNII